MLPSGDVAKILRRRRPRQKTTRLEYRKPDSLPFADGAAMVGPPLLLDTCVYIHALKGRTPAAVDGLLQTRTLFHSATAICELANRLGSRIPVDRREVAALREIETTIEDIPRHRVTCPSSGIWLEAGIVGGIRNRLAGTGAGQEGLNDVLILLQAARIGAAVLTANISDFDLLQQIVPEARVVFYRELSL